MSSPQMMRMLGFFGSAAWVTAAVINNANDTAATTDRLCSIALFVLMILLLSYWLCLFAEAKRAARFRAARRRYQSWDGDRLLARVVLGHLLPLIEHLLEVVARR